MANSKYEYVRHFEQPDRLPLGNWIVLRLDGRGFHRLSTKYGFAKPNDLRALKLMNKAAEGVMRDVPDVCMAYGHSDEYSFVLHHGSALHNRRASKLVSTVVSLFTAHYLTQWPAYFPTVPLAKPNMPCAAAAAEDNGTSTTPEATRDLEPELVPTGPLPTFDGRAVCYPRIGIVRDYLRWRQVDCHINNLYNTCFWALVQRGGMGNVEAEAALKGTYASDKNEILFQRFGVNYNNEPEIFKKGSTLVRELTSTSGDRSEVMNGDVHVNAIETTGVSKTSLAKQEKARKKARIIVLHEDLIGEAFWERRRGLLEE